MLPQGPSIDIFDRKYDRAWQRLLRIRKGRPDSESRSGTSARRRCFRIALPVDYSNETCKLPFPENIGTDIIKFLDEYIFNLLFLVNALIPNFTYFNMNEYTANGFDVPWMGALLPSLLITLGYLIPLILLGYFSLQLRELESK